MTGMSASKCFAFEFMTCRRAVSAVSCPGPRCRSFHWGPHPLNAGDHLGPDPLEFGHVFLCDIPGTRRDAAMRTPPSHLPSDRLVVWYRPTGKSFTNQRLQASTRRSPGQRWAGEPADGWLRRLVPAPLLLAFRSSWPAAGLRVAVWRGLAAFAGQQDDAAQGPAGAEARGQLQGQGESRIPLPHLLWEQIVHTQDSDPKGKSISVSCAVTATMTVLTHPLPTQSCAVARKRRQRGSGRNASRCWSRSVWRSSSSWKS